MIVTCLIWRFLCTLCLRAGIGLRGFVCTQVLVMWLFLIFVDGLTAVLWYLLRALSFVFSCWIYVSACVAGCF